MGKTSVMHNGMQNINFVGMQFVCASPNIPLGLFSATLQTKYKERSLHTHKHTNTNCLCHLYNIVLSVSSML